MPKSKPSKSTRRKPSRRKLYNDYLMANHAYAEAKSKADILKYLPRGLTWEQAKGDVKGWAADLREAEANLDRLAGSRIREVIEDVAVAAARQTFEHAKAALKSAILVERALSPEGDELRVSVSHALSVAGASLQEAFEKTRPPASKKRNSKIARIIVARRARQLTWASTSNGCAGNLKNSKNIETAKKSAGRNRRRSQSGCFGRGHWSAR